MFSALGFILLFLARVAFPLDAASSSPHIVVIGAGAAGLAATSRLLQNGFHVTLLEASDRFGGRVWSVPVEGLNGTLELGGDCFLNDENEIYSWAVDNHLVNLDEKQPSDPVIFPSEGIPLKQAESEVVQTTLDWLSNPQFYPDAVKTFGNGFRKPPSLGLLLQLGYVRRRTSSLNPAVSDAVYEYAVRKQRAENAVENLFQLGYGQMERNLQLRQPRCLTTSATELLQKFAPDATKVLRTNMLVSKIELTKSSTMPMLVSTSGGASFGADHVVLTSSLGFLKNNMESLFFPPLSKRKQEVVRAAGFGTTGKIHVAYNYSWWEDVSPDGNPFSEVILLRRSSSTRSIKKDAPPSAAKVWTDEIVRFDVSKSFPNGLTFMFAGRMAPLVDHLSDEQVSADLTKMLASFLTSLAVPSPSGIYRAKWSSNKLSLGTNSHFSTEFTANNYTMADLAAPDREFAYWKMLHGKSRSIPGLLFAGEATSPREFATIHGAILSGVREANRISMIYS